MSKIIRKTRTAQIDLNSPSPPKANAKAGEFDLAPDVLQVRKSPSKLTSPNKRNRQRVSILTDISFSHPKAIETQIVNKVEHVFFWGDGRNQNDAKVDITGDFNNWRRQRMTPIDDIQNINASIPRDATHYIKKSLDPKKYSFYFVVNNIDKISVQYEKNIGQNTNYVDLKHSQTQMFIKKKEKPSPLLQGTNLEEIAEIQSTESNYQTIEDFVKNEEINLDEEHEKDIQIVQEMEESLRDDEFTDESPSPMLPNCEKFVAVSDCDKSLDVIEADQIELKDEIGTKPKVSSALRLQISLTETFQGYQDQKINDNKNNLSNTEMVKDDFKLELSQLHSLPVDNRGRHTSRNSVNLKNFNFFTKYAPKSRKNSVTFKNQYNFLTQNSEDQNSQTKDKLDLPSSGSEGEDRKLDKNNDDEIDLMAKDIYDNIFAETFEENADQGYITKEQYNKALNQLDEEDSEPNDETQQQINHFLELYDNIYQNETGKIYQKYLIEAIKQDILKLQQDEDESPLPINDQEESPIVQEINSQEEFSPDSIADDLQRTKSSFIKVRQMSQDYNNNSNEKTQQLDLQKANSYRNVGEDRTEEFDFTSPSKINVKNGIRRTSSQKKLQVTAIKNGQEYHTQQQYKYGSFLPEKTNPFDSNQAASSGAGSNLSDNQEIAELENQKCQTSARKKRNSKLYNNFMNDFQDHNNEITGKGQQILITNIQTKIDMKNIKDPTLIKLESLTTTNDLTGQERSENLIQSTDYILQNKIKEYTQDPKLFECFLNLFKENQKKIMNKIEEQNTVIDNIKENGTFELQEFHQQNRELEAEIEILMTENDKLKRYEQCYHPMEERMKIEQEKNDQLFVDKENIEQAHSDLINEFNQQKQQNEQLNMEIRAKNNEIDGLIKQNASLKQSIIGGQFQSNDTNDDEEEDQDLCQEHENSPEEQDLEQDIPQPIEQTVRKEDFSAYKLTPQQVAMNKMTLDQENEILYELGVHDTYILSKRINDYIINCVQITREGQENLITKQFDKLVKYENKMRKKLITLKFRNDKLFGELKNTRFQQTQYQNLYQEKRREIDELQQKIQDLVNENNEIKDDKNRIIGVNQILEKRMQVEKSEMNTLQGDLQNLMTFGDQAPQMQKMKSGQFSSYTRNIKHAIRSNKGSMMSGVQRRGTIEEGYNQNMYLKNQNRNFGGGQSSFHDNGSMYSGIQPSATGTNYQNGGMIFDNASNFSRSYRSKNFINKIGNASIRGSMRGSIAGSMKGSVFSGRGRDGERVQKINAFSSQGSDESMMDITGDELTTMNQDIENEQQNLLKLKRQQNVYDLVGLADPGHFNYQKVEDILVKHYGEKALESGLKDRSTKLVPLKDAKEKSFYSEIVKVYINRSLKECILLIYQGTIYFIQLNETNKSASLLVQPFSLLDDINRVIFSEVYEKFLAFKLRDMRKTQGNRDHIVFELKDRELFADFVMEYAEEEEDEILFEANEEFSMIVNSGPVWFCFADVERLKKQDNERLLKSKDVTGFLEMKQIKNNVIKILFSKNAGWDNRYFALQGTKLFIYKGHDYNKPLQIIEINEDMKVQELSKKDTGGKQNVFQLTPGQNKQKIVLAASTQKNMENWIRAFKSIKDMFDQEKQKIIDKLKEDVVKRIEKKERVSVLFTQGGNLNLNQLQQKDNIINEASEGEEQESLRQSINFEQPSDRWKDNKKDAKVPQKKESNSPLFTFDDLFTAESGMRKQTIHKQEGKSIKNSIVDINLIQQQMDMQHKRKQTQMIKSKSAKVKVQNVQKIVDNDSNEEFKSCNGSDFSQ